jgi:hypothetical protein
MEELYICDGKRDGNEFNLKTSAYKTDYVVLRKLISPIKNVAFNYFHLELDKTPNRQWRYYMNCNVPVQRGIKLKNSISEPPSSERTMNTVSIHLKALITSAD